MKNVLLAIALIFATLPVFAQDQPTTSQQLNAELAKMSDAEKAEVLQDLQVGVRPSPTAAKAKEWVEIGSAIGNGLAETAGKLGVEVNKFAQSPVGKMTMLLIVWNYMGEEISGWICGILFLGIFLPLWIYNFRKTFGVYNEKGKFVQYDLPKFSDKSEYGVIILSYIAALVLITFCFIVFIA